MYRIFLLIFGITFYFNLSAQSPQAFKYQAVVRDNTGTIIANKNLSFRISIIEDTSTGTVVYTENHSITSNDYGMVNFNVGDGDGISSTLLDINWAKSHFLQIEIDIEGGSNYELMGVSQLLSVPYALYAENGSLWANDGELISYMKNVGIGTIAPSSKLEIVGDGSTEIYALTVKNDGTNSLNLYGAGDMDYFNSSVISSRSRGTVANPTALNSGDRIGGFFWRPYLSNDYQRTAGIHAYVGDGVSSTSYPTNIRFETTIIGSTERQEILRISENGNVGIGTITPLHDLDVNGIINANKILVNGSEVLTNELWGTNSNNIHYSAGNVGIGTIAPSSKLEIVGDGSSEIYTLTVKNDGTNSLNLYGAGDTDYFNSSVISSRSRGTVANPTALNSGDRVGGFFWRPYLSNDYQRTAGIHAYIGDGVSSTSYPTNIRFETTIIGSTEREEIMRIAENGNVGIGTQVPKSKLQITSGDVYIENINFGVIMKSPDGGCWRMTVDNTGNPVFTSISCPN